MDTRADIASTVGTELRSTKRVSAMPNIGLELTAASVRSCLASASSSSSVLAFGGTVATIRRAHGSGST
jgi:hypothetical protein